MTGLTDALRERLSRRGRTAQADCGALGVLTVEALSPGDCAALLRGSGGKRAVLYAACRELQRAGEDLRREGRVFTPEEIMKYVSDGELSAAVAAVLALSGAEDSGNSGADGTEEAAEPEEPETPEETQPPPSSLGEAGEQGRARMGVPAGADLAAGPGMAGAAEEADPPSPSGPAPERLEAAGGEGKTRLETVQEFRDEIPEIRQGFVRDGRAGTGPEMETGLSPGGKVRPKFVRERAGETKAETDGAGQASRETGIPAAIFRPKTLAGRKPQAFVSGTKNRAQNVAKAIGASAFFRQESGRPDGALSAAAHEIRSEFSERPHEIKSEFLPGGGGAAHETESEFPERAHEMKSDLPPEGGGAAHETESEFPERAHEIKSELPPEGGGMAHETKSEFPEGTHEIKSESAVPAGMTAALAERAAEFLLEGLRRAAGAR